MKSELRQFRIQIQSIGLLFEMIDKDAPLV